MSKIDELFYAYSLNNIDKFKELSQGQEEVIEELVNQSLNDKNSSTAREKVVLIESKYDHVEGKLNYDGVKDGVFCEVKLRNYDTSRTSQSKLNGEGSYSDYTWERYKKHSSENPDLLIGGFIDGKLIYIFKLKYNAPKLQERIIERLTSFFGDINSERKPNHYLRSLGFNFNNYNEDADLIYIAPKEVLCNNKSYISNKLYERLMNESK